MANFRKTTLGLIGLDIIAIFACFNLTLLFWGVTYGLVFAPLWVPVVLAMIAIYLVDGYKARTDMMSVDYTSQHAIALVSALIFTLLITYVVIPSGYELQSSRGVILVAYLALVPVTLSYRRIAYSQVLRARGIRSIVFVGDPGSCQAFHEECNKIGMAQPVIYSLAFRDPGSRRCRLISITTSTPSRLPTY